ncbi:MULTISPECIES: DUF1998 domain-containing protein [Gordonia]|nr:MULTISPECIES: DUF1998 domain-containing protein [Gordonia]
MSAVEATARRSQLVSTYGVGGLFPSDSSSFMIVGLDDWNKDRAPVVSEPRLARSLGVLVLKSPPASEGSFVRSKKSKDVPVIRFPRQQVCPVCRRIGTHRDLGLDWNAAQCKCQQKKDGASLSPFRLVAVCPRGHIDDFPVFGWLHAGQEYARDSEHRMTMKALGRTSSLDDLELNCSCGVRSRTLDKATDAASLKNIKSCSGRRPWLRDAEPEECREVLSVVQRGASNVWFPSVRSTISIPPYSEKIAKLVDKHWVILSSLPSDALRGAAERIAKAASKVTTDDILSEVTRRHDEESGESVNEEELRRQEFRALMEGRDPSLGDGDFVCEVTVSGSDFDVDVPEIFTDLRKVTRLREVRALRGFTRLKGDEGADELCQLSMCVTDWLPAIEVIGEGIFLGMDRGALDDWAAEPFAQKRLAMLQASADYQAAEFGRPAKPVDIVKVALHTFAHVLIDQLSLDAGYPASSLRERLYVDPEMAGILIYTASSDSAGSLGGVASQADPDRFAAAVREGLKRLSWCSSDPVCIETEASGTDAMNLAACHACVLAPETSCELNNTLLDRALLFGTHDPDEEDAGIFSTFVQDLD